ncbi:pregnancy-specific beta-1-glycoprotein 4-like isoform X2 [Lithobates pipiens]
MMTTAMCPLCVLLLWALLCPGRGNVQEEIFTRPGSDLLIPIRIHLTLNHTGRCDQIIWTYEESPGDWNTIAQHRNCDPSDLRYFPNTRISENGSLIISNVTPENDGRYRVYIENSTGPLIQRDDYFIHVEVPLSDITVTSSCLPDGSAEAECSVKGSDPRYSWSLDGRSVSSPRRVTLLPPVSGTLHCDVTNKINNLSRSINISCAVPLSDITVTSSCLPDGSAEAECSVTGSDPRYSWSLDGRSVSSPRRVTLPPPVSGTLRCDVTNQINNLSRSINISCAVPLSDITVTSSCLPDGSAEAECSVKGSDPRYSWSLDGRSVSSHRRVTLPPPVSGILHCDVTNQINNLSRSINTSCAVPVSDPVLDVRCLQNGSTEISCWVENGTDPSIYLTVSGGLEVYDVTSSERTVRVTVPPVSPPHSWNIRCSAKNNISERSTNQTQDPCPVPVSDPVLDVRCLQNDSAEISCWVENGTDPSIYLTVSGGLEVYNVTSSERTVRVTVPPVSPPDFWNIRCSAKNNISERSTNQTQDPCPDDYVCDCS